MFSRSALFVFLLLSLLAAERFLTPSFSHGKYLVDGQEHAFRLPLSADLPAGSIEVALDVSFPRYRPAALLFTPDDCLQSLSVNGIPVSDPQIPFCDYRDGRVIAMAGLWKEGTNRLTMQIKNEGGTGGIAINLAPSDPLRMGTWSVALALLIAYGLMLFRRSTLSLVLFWSAALLLLYWIATPYELRAHDAGGHLEYIRFIAQHWSVPPPQNGFEFYQPPLYYLLAAPLYALGDFLALPLRTVIRLLQSFSLSLSLGNLILSWWMARMLFPDQPKHRVAFLAFLGSLPALVFFSARINNDVLFGFLSFLTLALLLRWWRQPRRSLWCGIALCIGLGLLTKSSAAIFFPVALVILLLSLSLPWKKKFISLLILTILPLLIAGWLLIPRALENERGRALLIGNVKTLTNFVSNTPSTLLTFHPVQILRHPYNDPFDDRERRDYLWEFFFRSAFFGEFSFGTLRRPLAQLILLSALLLLPFAGWNLLRDLKRLRRSPALPLWVTVGAAAAALLLFRLLFPFSSSQDFRYMPILAVPWAFSLVTGWNRGPPFLRWIRGLLVGSLIGSCVLFLLSLVIFPA